MCFLTGVLRPDFWTGFGRTLYAGIKGNLQGEGRLLGGVFVIGPGEQGILLDHKEQKFGDEVSLTAVREAVAKIKNRSI
uniref:Peroxiredoxin-like 2A n=1 Tax=Eptatretus burgeri TaxID=7764 RepID=A0A8C4RAD9_EPTBU